MLQDEINSWSQEIQTTSYAMSIGELISLYEDHEIDLHPELQRFFRWDDLQKTRLIESILLGIPLPPIFVYQREDGIWEVIDGVQRLSTVFQFVRILQADNNQVLPPLKLLKTEYLPSLQGKMWKNWNKEDDEVEDPEHYLTMAQRIAIRRAKIDINILRERGDWNARYELFYRLNRGGTSLSEQDVRNFLVAMNNPDFQNFITELAAYDPFQQCIQIPKSVFASQYDLELVSKFIVYKNSDIEEISEADNIPEFLTKKLVELSRSETFDRDNEKTIFEQTFNLLVGILGEKSFLEFHKEQDDFTGRFSIAAYEAISIGIGSNIEQWNTDNANLLIAAFKMLWEEQRFLRQASLSDSERKPHHIAEVIKLGRELLSHAEDTNN